MLPILEYVQAIVAALRLNAAIIIAAETGAGKSTQVPLALLQAGFAEHGLIGVTQPRRVAAMNVSEWVASLHGSELGDTIGYQIKADSKVGRNTKVKFMTEGILLRELHSDPLLRKYSVLVIDEAHERGINQDLLIALLKGLMERRPDLKIVIMSATINEDKFSAHLGGAPVIKVPGRVFPVEVRYEDRAPERLNDMVDLVAEKVQSLLLTDSGDILAFLPNEATIKAVCAQLTESADVRILPLYGSQDPTEQRDVFKRTAARRVIVATNIAETSLTIDGVRHVIDTGLIKAVRYVNASMSALTIMEHSRAGCDQRKGRAGRTADGVCHRLYSQSDYQDRDAHTVPEILRTSLDQVLLHLRVLEYTMNEVRTLPFMDPPSADRWNDAETRLRLLGAIHPDGNVTKDGFRLERLPVAPMLGRMLLAAEQYGCVSQVATIVAGMSSRQLFVRPKGKDVEADIAHSRFKATGSDALALRAAVVGWVKEGRSTRWAKANFLSTRALEEIARNRSHILETLERGGMKVTDAGSEANILKAIAAGLIVNLCMSASPHSYVWQGREVFIHPGSAARGLMPRFVVCTEVVVTSRAFARGVTAIDEAWLEELLPEDVLDVSCRLDRGQIWNPGVRINKQLLWQGTPIRSYTVETPSEGDLRRVAAGIVSDVMGFTDAHPVTQALREQWNTLLRLKSVPDWTRTEDSEVLRALQAQLVEHVFGLIRHAQSARDVVATPLTIPVLDWITPEERAVYDLRHRVADEAQERVARTRAAERAATEERLAPLYAEIDTLLAEAQHYSETNTHTVWMLQDARRWLAADIPREYETRVAVTRARQYIEQIREQHAAEIAQTTKAHAQALSLVPACPLCDAAWSFNGQRAVCTGVHNLDRVMRAAEESNHVLLRLATNRGDSIATVTQYDQTVVFTYAHTASTPWVGRVFSTVEARTELVILPEDLLSQREALLRDIADLKQMRKEAEQLVQTVAGLQSRVKDGTVRQLTFRIQQGMAMAEEGGTIYSAAYGDLYPDDGETWFCIVPRSQHEMRRTIEVTPILKAGSVKGREDVVEFEQLVLSAYPGLPAELLN